jgi:hypothetical protein
MDEATFWHIIETAKAESEGDCDQQVRLLEQRLAQLPPEELQRFDRILGRFHREAYFDDDLRVAAYMINGGGSEDGFTDFCAWLIAQGEAIFYSVLQNPETLANLVEPTEEIYKYTCEHIRYIAWRAYELNTGQEMPLEEPSDSEIAEKLRKENTPAGKENPWGADGYLKEEYARKYFPKLWTKFGC